MRSKLSLLIHVALFPIQNLQFYGQQHMLDALDYRQTGGIGKSKQQKAKRLIERKLYAELLRKAEPSSLDEINLLVQKFYPMLSSKNEARRHDFIPSHEDEETYSVEKKLYQHYFHIIEEFSAALLSYRDGDIIFKYWRNDANGSKKWSFIDFMAQYSDQDKVIFFQALNRTIPIDLMIALHHSNNNIHDPLQLHELYQHINLADAPLDDILARGVAENHIHASAAFNFSILWQMMMNGVYPPKYFESFTTNHLAASSEVESYLWTARLLRLVLSHYLKDWESGAVRSLYEWIEDSLATEPGVVRLLHELYHNQYDGFAPMDKLKEAIERIQITFMENEASGSDFIFRIFPEHQAIKTYGEHLFLFKVMAYRRQMQDKSGCVGSYEQFFRLFFMYIAIKNEFYQQVTQPTVLRGLDFFRGYFDRATDGIAADQSYYTMLLRTLFQNRYLQKVELRLSVASSETENRKRLLRLLESYKHILVNDYDVENDPQSEFPLIGIVYHLIKRPDDVNKDFWWFDEERDHTLKHLHFGEHQEKYMKQVQMVQQLRRNVPMVTNFIVGLDAASLEHYTPVQVFAPVFEEARDSKYDSLRILDPEGNILPRQSLFFTFHAGEEFRHLGSGLRRIDEVIEYCKLHAGDRIGHGIALGVPVEEWAKRNPVVILPRGEYLDNLLWVWGVYSRTTQFRTEAFIYLERQIDEMADCIFNDIFSASTPGISTLFKTYKRRFLRIKDEISKVNLQQMKREGEERRLHLNFPPNSYRRLKIKKINCLLIIIMKWL
ncbi:hypothetical protein [Paenibacillus ehimensis]|uniref:hypothetical protein n=1 Tax=Paenibacillus ehimensis TaxID=79264 RepID=UPI0004715E73|nr:hypothetical protein [Paenibacillus ehimensis]